MKTGWILIFFLLITAPAISWSGEPDGGAALGGNAAASEPIGAENCQDLAAAIRESQIATGRDLGQIKRDLARLQQKLEEPGIGQIFSGIGYIFGLFGVAAFVASRKK
jgi:nickel transport protein